MPLLLGVWREACKHVDLAESASRIAPILSRRTPIDVLIVRRLDVKRAMLETIAVGSGREGPIPEMSRNDLSEPELEEALAWCRHGGVTRLGPRSKDRLAWLLPERVPGSMLAGPISGPDGPIGAVILLSRPPRVLEDEHAELFQALLEPLSVAIENDRRARELRSLREAAEADKRSLLVRLGRSDLTDTIVGAEGGLRAVLDRVALVAPSDAPVLIFGETGSGKEVIARAVHSRSRRSTGPFLRVNCGAIPPELIDSELFGHERGSFTGAENVRQGWFERADAGTLFLDEIGELTSAAQVRLLRIVQDGTFQRVGGQKQLHADVRIVAATHRDLQSMCLDGRFREDLWYRLAVFPLHLPPLRERPEDIPAMATHFALKAARRFGTAPHVPTPADVSLLVSYPWPGNVRELAAVMERATILGNGRSIEVGAALGNTGAIRPAPQTARSAFVPPHPSPPPPVARPIASAHDAAAEPLGAGADMGADDLNTAMTRHIENALRSSLGRIEGPFGAAARLRINPHTLRSRMRKLGINWKNIRVAAKRESNAPGAASPTDPGEELG